jgi:hypothetical protein
MVFHPFHHICPWSIQSFPTHNASILKLFFRPLFIKKKKKERKKHLYLFSLSNCYKVKLKGKWPIQKESQQGTSNYLVGTEFVKHCFTRWPRSESARMVHTKHPRTHKGTPPHSHHLAVPGPVQAHKVTELARDASPSPLPSRLPRY